jgi:15-cis-phytoene synthase
MSMWSEMVDRPTLITHARASIARGSKSFSAASKLFDRQTRERVWMLYAWCRKCDDMADGQDHGGAMEQVADPMERLAQIKALTARAIQGEATGDPAFDCLGIVAAECGLTQQMADDVIAGFALDAKDWRPRSEDDLYQYCYHVAGAVGVMMAVVMGVSPKDNATLDRACDLGLAFQLANIARDIEEDDAAERCYLPAEWIAYMDIEPGQHMKPHYRDRLALLAKRLCDAAERYEASARVGAAKLPLRSRWAVLTAAGIYGDIAREVRRKSTHAWDSRVYTSKVQKLGWAARAFGQALANKPNKTSREALWTRKA